MDDTKRMISCICGYQFPEESLFCPNCGMTKQDIQNNIQSVNNNNTFINTFIEQPVSGPIPFSPQGVFMSPEAFSQPENADDPPDDSGLTLLVDCCKKTLATGCGDSCDETVLYLDEKTGEYQIHTYYTGFGSTKEIHRGYRTDKEVYDKIMDIIISSDLPQYEGRQGIQMCGGEYVCKFLYEGRIIRLTSSVVFNDSLYTIGSVLKGYIKKENEIFGKK